MVAQAAHRVVPLTPEHWPALERLFGKQGACMGCWCMHWRMPHKEWQEVRGGGAKRLFKRRVAAGPPPGVIALEGEDAIGWLQIGPRSDAPQWTSPKRVSAPLDPELNDDPAAWVASCFYVKSGRRGQGISDALLEGGLAWARKNRARVIDACPMEPAGRASASGLYVGHVAVFRRAGFTEIARRKDNRPLMRLALSPSRKPKPKRG